jgi:hypothetical protein
MRHHTNLERDGFLTLGSVFEPREIDWILDEFKALPASDGISNRGGKVFGVRNLFEKLPSLRSVVDCALVKSLVKQLVGDEARPVRSLFFDKNSAANWNVAWHQDLTIAVRRALPVEGFGSWTLKAGVPHVQPPFPILQRMLALRIHLDDADESNGALRVIPGSHKLGRLSPSAIEQIDRREPSNMRDRCWRSIVHETAFVALFPILQIARSSSRTTPRIFCRSIAGRVGMVWPLKE